MKTTPQIIPFPVFAWVIIAFTAVLASSQDQSPSLFLSQDELKQLRDIIFSDSIGYAERAETAFQFTLYLEEKERSRFARKLCLDFYESVAAGLRVEKCPPLEPAFIDIANAIDRGKRIEAIQQIKTFFQQSSPDSSPHPGFAILGLKSDSMGTAYGAFYSDLTNKTITPFSIYLIGILAVRENRFVEAEQFLEQIRGQLLSNIFERWLSIDLAKIYIVTQKLNQAKAIVSQLLQQNPNDAQALDLQAFIALKENRKDTAHQLLFRLIQHLYEDPYLIAETANIALELNELETAAKLLEEYQNKVEPNHNFYQIFSIVRMKQGRAKEAEQLAKMATQIKAPRVEFFGKEPLKDTLLSTLQSSTHASEPIEGVDTLSQVYIYLIEHNLAKAVEVLVSRQNNTSYERWVLATLYHRIGQFDQALKELMSIHEKDPMFRPYQVRCSIADLLLRTDKFTEARQAYQGIIDQFPDSYQARAAVKFAQSLANTREEIKILNPIHVSPMLSRFNQYAAPFVLAEIRNYWGDPSSFAALNKFLGTSPRRGINFIEFLEVFQNGSRYKIDPLIGTPEVVRECLEKDVPVVFCQGEMFYSQYLTEVLLITGYNPLANQFYTEGVTPSSPTFLTAEELMEGICFAIYRTTFLPEWSPTVLKSIQAGAEFVRIDREAYAMKTTPEHDAREFTSLRERVVSQEGAFHLPFKLAFARWTIRNKPISIAIDYFRSLEPSCGDSAHFWFLYSLLQYRNKQLDEALKLLDRSLRRNPNSPRVNLSKIRILYQSGSTQTALSLAEEMRKHYPEDPVILANLIDLYSKEGNTEQLRLEKNRLKNLFHIELVDTESVDNEQ